MPSISDHLEALRALTVTSASMVPDVERAAQTVVGALKNGNKLLTCGNGGSATDAMHMAEELVGRYKSDRVALPAIALNADGSVMTCIANDWSFDVVFSRQVEALGQEGDILVVFSTSGNSPNLLAAMNSAREKGMTVVALLGNEGGEANSLADIACVVPSSETARIQEMHTWILHVILEEVEEAFAREG